MDGTGVKTLRGPGTVSVARVEVLVRVPRQAVELSAKGPFAELRLLVAFFLPPFCSTVLEPNLETGGGREYEKRGGKRNGTLSFK